jgi:hypothetical protein
LIEFKCSSINLNKGIILLHSFFLSHLLFSLKDVMVQFIKTRRLGKEIILDLKVGYLHAYSNGNLQLELQPQKHTCLQRRRKTADGHAKARKRAKTAKRGPQM